MVVMQVILTLLVLDCKCHQAVLAVDMEALVDDLRKPLQGR